ncbi:MAG: hypothetical protein ACLFV3_09370 [Phycisphaeraceae bacterium]
MGATRHAEGCAVCGGDAGVSEPLTRNHTSSVNHPVRPGEFFLRTTGHDSLEMAAETLEEGEYGWALRVYSGE